METLRQILDPHFLLRNSVYVSMLVGFACPLAGIYLILRRLIFMGVALPQISSAGIAFAFCLPALGLAGHMHLGHFEGDDQISSTSSCPATPSWASPSPKFPQPVSLSHLVCRPSG